MRLIDYRWRIAIFVVWCVVVYVSYFLQFVPYLNRLRGLLSKF